MITYDASVVVVGFLDPYDIKKLMKTCKQIHSDKQVRKICMDKLTEQYTMRLYPVDGAKYRIKTRGEPQPPRVFRIYTRFGDRSANLCLGAPEFDQIDAAYFHVHYQFSMYTFYTPERPFMENGRVSEVPVNSLVDDTFLNTITGISFGELNITLHWDVMRAVLVVHRARHPTLTLRVMSTYSGTVDDRAY
jgi:hypothetical protein